MAASSQKERVDLDLDAEDKALREAIGLDTSVKFKGRTVHFAHPMTWSNQAMDASISGDFGSWAREVIRDEEELEHFLAQNPLIYQFEAIFKACVSSSGLDVPKSAQSGPPSAGTRTTSKRTSTGTIKG